MGLNVGIVGLPNVGKSTIFNALTAAGAQSANYPFCTIEPNVGIVPVVDKRLDTLAELAESKQTIYTDLKIVDIAGLVRGASKGEGLGNQFLANIRETDAILHVVRCFEDPNVVHVEGTVDPERDIEVIETELLLADLDALNKKMDRVGVLARVGLREPGLNVLSRSAFQLLNRESFFTAGPKEARAWTLHRGSKAPQAGGEIHSDFERGFIRAETIGYDEYIACGSEQAARAAGKM